MPNRCLYAHGVAALLALTSVPMRVHAHSDSDVFRWDAPNEECPSESEVFDQLALAIDVPLDELRAREVFFIARVRPGEHSRWELRLFYLTKSGRRERSIEGDDCRALAVQAALLTALAIEAPSGSLTRELAEPRFDPVEIVPHELDSTDALRPSDTGIEPADTGEPEPTRARRFELVLPLRIGAGYGERTSVAPLLRVGLGLAWRRARVEIAGHYATSTLVVDGRRNAMHDAFALVRGCHVAHPRPKLELPTCAGVEAGAVLAPGLVDARAAWFAFDLSLGLAWVPSRHVALTLNLEPWATPTTTQIVGLEHEIHWQAGHVGVRFMAGGEARF